MHRSTLTRPRAWTFTRPFLLLLTATAVLGTAACARDEILAPIDGTPCARGTLSITRPTEGAVTGRDCAVWSDIEFGRVSAETWTLPMRANTGYVVQLIAKELSPGVTPFRGNLVAYERDAQGEPQLVSFGDGFGPGGRNRELVLTTRAARTVALRVEVDSPADTGSYRIEISTCPVIPLVPDSIYSDLSTATGCRSQALFNSDSRLRFFTLVHESLDPIMVGFERSSGTASLSGLLSGPDLDVNGLLSGSLFARSAATTSDFFFDDAPERIGRYTMTVRVHADSSATFRVLHTTEALLRASQPR
jgi:hypothetical protein